MQHDTSPTSVNGSAPLPPAYFDPDPEPARRVADDVARRFAEFAADGDVDLDIDDNDGDDVGEDSIPQPVTSISDRVFAVDPRPPVTVHLCKPRGSRTLFLAARTVRR